MKNVMFLILLCTVSICTYGQKSTHKKAKKDTAIHIQAPRPLPPEWAAAKKYDMQSHVYFPDYYAYYDPARGGYLFWENGKWSFTPTVPPYLEHVDLSNSRIEILKGLSLDLHPEQNYPHYMKLYPAQDVGNSKVPVPVPNAPGN